ncbi:DEAD/DEAH box helicase family protein [Halolamina salifodinae]|uniref:DNA 3'-5' helicase n=1 Tax=Halolamina salifodinae TaxID=1202767 RepID=A0A8T4GYJ6_9EURY|nr:DEAD/DEAH box helicase family protein [Halolamina salifodinae]MBP1988066.1 superfamily II DNA or RNA helicase/DNA-binding transcriptional regulator WhiA/transcriptional regulator with XRE-family HTH domain [Halolamina salifodinae]
MTELSLSEFYDAVEAEGRPLLTADEFARRLEETQADADEALTRLADEGLLERVDVENDPVVWFPTEWGELASRERVIVFPERREIVVDRPTQYTQARLSQFAHLVDTTGTEPGTRGYLYRIRPEDVWSAPFDGVADLILTMRGLFPRRYEGLEEWVESQWKRANRFRLDTHEDGYTVLTAATDDLLGNVAMEKLDEDAIRAPISDTEAWVNEDAIAGIKRTLYEAGYPVVDDRDLERGDPIDADLTTDLREYQQSWVDSFLEKQAGVLVGPPGSGKTVAALGALTEIGGETLILVPSRELAGQWREEIQRHTTVDPEDVGEYHGGTKQLRPITIATYQIAGMDRHRKLFDEREWGLITMDECLPGDTIVETPDGRTTFDKLDDEFGFKEGWNTDLRLSVRTFDSKTGEYEFDRVNGVFKSTAKVEHISVSTGHELRATPGHTHMVFDPETGEITEQTGVTEGDYLLRPTPVASEIEEATVDERCIEAELLGWFLGDGHITERGDGKFSFGTNTDQQAGIIEWLGERLAYEYTTYENERGDVTVRFPKLDNELTYGDGGGPKTETVSVPSQVYQWPEERISSLLRGLFDAEGSVSEKGRIQFNTVSSDLADDVALLLQKLGIPTRRMLVGQSHENHNDIHRLNISSAFGERFGDVVGFRLQHKQRRLRNGASPSLGLPAGPLLQDIKSDTQLTNEQLAEMMGLARQTVGDVLRGRYQLGQGRLQQLASGLREFATAQYDTHEQQRENYRVTYEQLGEAMAVSTGSAYRKTTQATETAIEGIDRIVNRRKSAANRHADLLERLRQFTVVEVTNVTETETETVYDFETESHTFLADGFLTHNCHHIPAPMFRRAASFQSKHRLGLTATPVRESDDETDIYTLIGPPLGTDWSALFDAGFVAEPEVELRYLPWDDEMAENEWANADGRERHVLAGSNPRKIEEIEKLLADHDGKALVFVDYLDQGEAVADAVDAPFVSGETPHHRRERLFESFRTGELDVLIVSRVGDEGIDLPNAELAVVASGLGGSRRQGAQRAGRTMRPVGRAEVVVLATHGTSEEEFARRQMRHLAEKGVRVHETVVGADEEEVGSDEDRDGDGEGDEGGPAE